MKMGAEVGIAQPVLKGKVVDVEWDKAKDCKRLKVAYTNDEGVEHTRWFTEPQLIDLKATEASQNG